MRIRFAIILATMAALATACVGADVVQLPKTQAMTFEKQGFAVQVPVTAVRNKVADVKPGLVSEVFTFGELIYSVKIVNAPPETLAETAIETDIQARAREAVGVEGARRWEIENKDLGLFKGVNVPAPAGESALEAPYIKKALWGREAWQSAGMAALGEKSDQILILAVTGPKSRASEIENLAMFFAKGATKPQVKATPSLPPVPPTRPSQKLAPVRHPVASPTTKPAPPAATIKPTPKPKPVALRKGEIELTGVVESVEASQKCLVLIVDSVRMPSTRTITLDPPRRKTVYYNALPEGIDVNSGIRVVGKNSGVGMAMKADTVTVATGND